MDNKSPYQVYLIQLTHAKAVCDFFIAIHWTLTFVPLNKSFFSNSTEAAPPFDSLNVEETNKWGHEVRVHNGNFHSKNVKSLQRGFTSLQ